MTKSSGLVRTRKWLEERHPEIAASMDRLRPGEPGFRAWSAAKPTSRPWPGSNDTVTFPSKCEARVFDRLAAEVAATPGARLYRQVPLWLHTISPNGRGVPYVLRVDFAVVVPGSAPRFVEAKTRRKSREWARGAAAARAAGYAIVEVDR